MSIFITEDEILMHGTDNYFLVLCCSEGNQPSEYIFGSSLLYLPKSPSSFMQLLRSLSIQSQATVICYDNSNYLEAALGYWGFKSLKLNAKILIRCPSVYQTLKVLSGMPDQIPTVRTLFNEISSKVLTTRKKLVEKKKDRQILRINTLPFNIVDSNGKITHADIMRTSFESAGISIPNTEIFLIGKKAALVGVCFKYIGFSEVVLVLDDYEAGGLTRKKEFGTFVYGANGNDMDDDDSMVFNSLQSLRLSGTQSRLSVSRKGVCGNCVII